MPSTMNPKEPWQLAWEEEIQNDREGFAETTACYEDRAAQGLNRLIEDAQSPYGDERQRALDELAALGWPDVPRSRTDTLATYQQRERQNARDIADAWKCGR